MELRRIDVTQPGYHPSVLLIPVALLLVLIIANPVPLVGGYTDDYRYLVGAQCLECLPTNHWERRFAIVWPTGIAIQLFGQNLWSVMIFPVAASIAAVVLTFKLVEHQYGRKAALVAGCVLVLTPVFGDRSMRIAIDMIELVFVLGAVFVLQRRKGHFWAGILIALAVLCRPTVFAALPLIGFFAWWQDPRSLKWFALGFVMPLAIEALAYLALTGDPLYPWKLSLNHMAAWRASMEEVRLSQFMSPDVDTNQSPLFNPNNIGGWMPTAGIEAHWTVQGIINLLVSSECGLTLSAGLIAGLLAWKHLDRLQLALIICAGLYFGALTYAFAVDPRPRMFLPIVVIAATLIGSLAPKLWVWPRKLVVITVLALIVVVGAVKAINRIDYRPYAEEADKLIALQPYLVTSNARQRLALIRQDFPAGGSDLIEIDDKCPLHIWGRELVYREGSLCIYRWGLPQRMENQPKAMEARPVGTARPKPAGCPRYIPTASTLVAHAGGGLPDRTYSNNLEALNLAAKHGFTLIELDFIERDGELLLGHDPGRMSDLSLSGLMEWLDRNPFIYIITDIKTDNLSGLRLIKRAAGYKQQRFIPQIYQPEQLWPARSMGYSRVIFAERVGESRDWFPWVNHVPLWAVTISKRETELAHKIRHPVFFYTVNEPRSGVGLYTDCLIPMHMSAAAPPPAVPLTRWNAAATQTHQN